MQGQNFPQQHAQTPHPPYSPLGANLNGNIAQSSGQGGYAGLFEHFQSYAAKGSGDAGGRFQGLPTEGMEQNEGMGDGVWEDVGMDVQAGESEPGIMPLPNDLASWDPELLDLEFGGSDEDAEGEMDTDMPEAGMQLATSSSLTPYYPPLEPSTPLVPQSIAHPPLAAVRPPVAQSIKHVTAYPANASVHTPTIGPSATWKGYPATQAVMVDPRSIIQGSRAQGDPGRSIGGQAYGRANAVAGSSKVPFGVLGGMTIAPSQLQSAVRPKAAAPMNIALSAARAQVNKLSTPVAAAVLAGARPPSTVVPSSSRPPVVAKPLPKVVKPASPPPNPLFLEVRALFHRDRLADSVKSPLPKLVQLLGQLKSETDERSQAQVILGAKDTLDMMENMRMAPKRFQKEFAGDPVAVDLSLRMLRRCVSGMQQDGDDIVTWARACLAAIAFSKVIGQYLLIEPIKAIVDIAKDYTPEELSARISDELKDKLKSQRKELRKSLKTRVSMIVSGAAQAEEEGKTATDAPAKKRKSEDGQSADNGKKIKKERSPPPSSRSAGSSIVKARQVPTAGPKRHGANMTGLFAMPASTPAVRAMQKPPAPAGPDPLASLFKQSLVNAPVQPIKVEEEEDKLSESGQANGVKAVRLGKGGRPLMRVRWKPDKDLVAIREIEGRDRSLIGHDGHAQNLEHEGWAMRQMQELQPWYQPEYMEYAGGGTENASQEQHQESIQREQLVQAVHYNSADEVPSTPREDANIPISTFTPNTLVYLDLRRIVKDHPHGLAPEQMDSAFESHYELNRHVGGVTAGPAGGAKDAVGLGKVPLVDNAQLAGLLSALGPRPTASTPPIPNAAPVPVVPVPDFDISILQRLGSTLRPTIPQAGQPGPLPGVATPAFAQANPAFGYLPGQQPGSFPQQQFQPPNAPWGTNQQGGSLNGFSNAGWGRNNGPLPTPTFPGSKQGQQRRGGGGQNNGGLPGMCRFEKNEGRCVKDNCIWIHQNPRPGQN